MKQLPEENPQIQIFHRANRLKAKATGGDISPLPGYLDAESIQSAQDIIDMGEEDYKAQMEKVMTKMTEAWGNIKSGKMARGGTGQACPIFNYANNIKDLAETYQYDLMKHFGVSLRDFSEKMDTANVAHETIVQAHIDVMWVSVRENLRGEDEAKAIELKKTVAQAIQKHLRSYHAIVATMCSLMGYSVAAV